MWTKTQKHGPVVILAAAGSEAAAVWMGISSREATGEFELWAPNVAKPGLVLVRTGVGKSNAAAATALALSTLHPAAIVSTGVCGQLPAATGRPELLSVVLATRSVYADEGSAMPEPEGFREMGAIGFPLGPFGAEGVAATPELAGALRGLADAEGAIATVSTCSGTDAHARMIAQRTGAIAEGMEGAAVGHVVAAYEGARAGTAGGEAGVPCAFAEIRVVSNTTGDRGRQEWRLREALERLTVLAQELSRVLGPAGG